MRDGSAPVNEVTTQSHDVRVGFIGANYCSFGYFNPETAWQQVQVAEESDCQAIQRFWQPL
jgi:hypothetical protein